MDIRNFVQINDNWLHDVENDITLEKGGDYFRQRLVSLTDCEKEDDTITLNAQVKSANSRKVYDVSISFGGEGEVYQYECNCPAYYNYEGPCKHCVATVLAYNAFYANVVVPKLKAIGLTRQDSAVSPQTPDISAATRNSRGAFAFPNGNADNASVADYYARQQQERIKAEQERQAKLALQRTGNLLSAYKQIVVNEVKENGSRGQNHSVTLVPVMDISVLQSGVFLSFQIRKRSEQEIAGDSVADRDIPVADGNTSAAGNKASGAGNKASGAGDVPVNDGKALTNAGDAPVNDGKALATDGKAPTNTGNTSSADAESHPTTTQLPSAYTTSSALLVNQFPRAYIVKAINEFMNATSRHDDMRYGKELSFKALDSAYDETSIRWLGFLQKRYSECWRIVP